MCELPLHISVRACVCMCLSLPLSLCRRRDCHQSHCVPARIPAPPSAYPPPTSPFSPTSIQQQLARSHGATQLPLPCLPRFLLSPSVCVCFFFLPLHDIPITHMNADRIRLKPRGSTKVECEQCENRLWLSDIESEHSLRTAINVTINNDDRSQDSNHREYSVIWLITEHVCECVSMCVCRYLDLSHQQLCRTAVLHKGREKERGR